MRRSRIPQRARNTPVVPNEGGAGRGRWSLRYSMRRSRIPQGARNTPVGPNGGGIYSAVTVKVVPGGEARSRRAFS